MKSLHLVKSSPYVTSKTSSFLPAHDSIHMNLQSSRCHAGRSGPLSYSPAAPPPRNVWMESRVRFSPPRPRRWCRRGHPHGPDPPGHAWQNITEWTLKEGQYVTCFLSGVGTQPQTTFFALVLFFFTALKFSDSSTKYRSNQIFQRFAVWSFQNVNIFVFPFLWAACFALVVAATRWSMAYLLLSNSLQDRICDCVITTCRRQNLLSYPTVDQTILWGYPHG